MNNPQTLPPPDAEGDGIYQKLARCSSVGEIKRMLEGNGMVIKTAAERDRLIEDKENFEILINTLDGEVTRLKASNEALVNLLERCKEPITYYYRKKEDWGLCENINTALTKRGETQ